MTTPQIPAGRRRHRLTLTGPGTEIPDGRGGWTSGVETIADPVYGDIVPASARDLERVLSSAVASSASHLVTIPYVPGVTLTSGVVFHDPRAGARTFTISGILDPDERHIQLVLACDEAK